MPIASQTNKQKTKPEVPPDSVLDLVLFPLLINDLPAGVNTVATSAFFANDIGIITPVLVDTVLTVR
jgi:hypothetical protein